ncbi:gliding motility lipoprotein GldJ [Flavobacteriaceae bacterium AU392]|nr:gliding motility lipoprotein GldJ [Flavobacteriaceae bacterium]RKM82935.1 gliding motility lipoprotein GldJ [Flavobacteriaceae bacterium AU392]
MKNFASMRTMFVIAILSSFFYSCSKSSSSSSTSRGTGWKINDKKGGFQFNSNFKEQETPVGTVFVEGGTFTMGKVQDDVMHEWNNAPNQQHVQSFYMDETEVTNKMYKEFLDWTKRVYPPTDPRFKAIYEGILPDTLVWRNRLGYSEVAVNNYLRHPGYAEYPVVGVSWIQAVEYANWRTDRVAELKLQNEGYLERGFDNNTADASFSTDTYVNAPTKSFGGNDSIINPEKSRRRIQTTASGDTINRYAKRESGLIPLRYRLPSEAEWEYAALGLNELRDYNVRRGRKKYPWDGKYTRSGKRRVRGDQLANFKQGKGDYGGIAGWSDDGADITAQVKSYDANDYGLYDMAGNVAEWVADVYRPIVDDEFNDFNYYRGNVYTKNAINDDGTVKIVTTADIVYDTLSNGKLIARNLPGEIAQVGVDENETYLRTNFDRSNNINFRDGDKRSSRDFQSFNDEDEEGDAKKSNTSKMYNAPNHRIERDSTGAIIREFDKSNNRTSLINDEARVYKGGSWKDREYWLDPAQRRYFPQDKATDYIGFRCAVSRVGSKSKSKFKKKN